MADVKIIENMYVNKNLAGVEDLNIGFGQVKQVRANSTIPITQLNASHLQGVMVFDTVEELQKTDATYMGTKQCAVVKETGQLYFRYGASWGTVQNIAFQVKTVEDLKMVPPDVGICAVSDPLRGGLFSYDKANEYINNGGTIFYGWTRNYDNEVNVRWFGAKGNGLDDDTEALSKALAFSTVIVIPEGQYLISKPLVMQPNSSIRGTANTTIKCESQSGMLNVAVGSTVENIQFIGLPELDKQIGITVERVGQVRIVGCKFHLIGGKALVVREIEPGQSNEIVECVFTRCNKAVLLEENANNTIVSNCMFLDNGDAITHSGYPAVISNNIFINNGYALNFVAGALPTAETSVSSCSISNSKQHGVDFTSVAANGYSFTNCVISDSVALGDTSNVLFTTCNFNGASVYFSRANENRFIDCFVEGTSVSNGSGTYESYNYWVNPISVTKREDFSEGAWVEGTRNYGDFTLTANSVNTLRFDTVTQGACFHPNFNKFKLYDPNTHTFDLTKLAYPSNPDSVKLTLSLTFSKNTTNLRDNMVVFVYRLLSADEDISQTLDSSRMLILPHAIGWENSLSFVAFNGSIPRGYYRICARLGNVSDVRLLSNHGGLINGKGTVRQICKFWGV